MKILYVTTISNTVNAFLIPHIKMLIEQGHQVDVAFNVVQEVSFELIELGCVVYNLEFQRSPLNRQNYIAYKKLNKLICDEKYELVHTHTPVASTCVRLACRMMENVKVIYTAHGFHFFKGAPLLNWLVYYPIERWLARYTDVLITINKEDYARAKKSFKTGRVECIPGVGLDTKKFSEIVVDKLSKRREIGATENSFVILSIGELNKNKNHETVIKSIAKLSKPNVYYVICGQGPQENYLRDLSKELGLEKQVKLLGYRRDIDEICKAADIFVFPSIREGLSMALMEAMANGLPIICSNIRGNTDLIEDGKGGFLVNPDDVDGFAEAIEKLEKDKLLRGKIGQHNLEIVKDFDIEKVNKILERIYVSVINSLKK